MTTLAAVLAAVVGTMAQQEFSASGGHGGGHYHYNGAGVFLFWFFFIVVMIFLLFGCVGGVYSWGGHTHTVHIGRIVDRDSYGNVVRVRDVRDATVTEADDDPYYHGGGGGGGGANQYNYTPSVQPTAPYTQGSSYDALPPQNDDYGYIPVQRNEAGVRVQPFNKDLPGGLLPMTGTSSMGQERPLTTRVKQPLTLIL